MAIRVFLAALLAALAVLARADVAVPDTPAGHAFSAWLDAFNSSESGPKEAFIKTYGPQADVDDSNWRAATGGYDLLEVYSNDKSNIFFRVKARSNGGEEIGRLSVSDTEPVAVEGIGTWRVPAGTTLAAVPLDAKARSKLVARVADAFETSYVYPEVGKKMSAALHEHEKRGEYRSIRYGIDLARELTEDLREISHDKHAEVRFSFFVRPLESVPNAAEDESRRLAAMNCGFQKVEHLRPNIGYVKVDMFADTAICGPTGSAAMNFVANSDALIIDLRDNHGGGGGMVEFIASYLFEQRTHVEDMVDRTGHVTSETWTSPDVPGKKFIGKPVYVLQSKQTFSAAEAFSYDLKQLQRVSLVGETTFGGAHPVEIRPIDDHFSVAVPFARSRNPITQTNWEGTGVEPDVKVSADEALDVAIKLAAEAISRQQRPAGR
jgi:hypothetical protein